MTEQTSSITASLVSALREARTDSAIEDQLKRRTMSRLSVSLLGLTPTLGGAVSASRATGAAAKGGAVAVKAATSTKFVVAAWLAPVFAAGMFTGVVVDRIHVRHSAPLYIGPPTVAAQASVSANLRPQETEAPTLSPENLEDVSDVPGAKSTSKPDVANSLAQERRLLDDARQALARGEPQNGLTPLELHVKRFPKGMLTEEREALAVRLLSALGNREAALARADSFHARFPNSLFTPAVNNALATFSRRTDASQSNP